MARSDASPRSSQVSLDGFGASRRLDGTTDACNDEEDEDDKDEDGPDADVDGCFAGLEEPTGSVAFDVVVFDVVFFVVVVVVVEERTSPLDLT